MKKTAYITILFIFLGALSSYAKDEYLLDGRYVFTCSKLYSGLCDITLTDEQYQMRPIEKNEDGYIYFKRSWADKLEIKDSGMGSSEISLTLTGKAKRVADGSFIGRMRLSYYAVPIIPGRISWADWSLRPATQEEIHSGFLNGLKAASQKLRRMQWMKKPPKQERDKIQDALLGGKGEGYSHNDVSQLMKWYDEGMLVISDNQFILKKEPIPR